MPSHQLLLLLLLRTRPAAIVQVPMQKTAAKTKTAVGGDKTPAAQPAPEMSSAVTVIGLLLIMTACGSRAPLVQAAGGLRAARGTFTAAMHARSHATSSY